MLKLYDTISSTEKLREKFFIIFLVKFDTVWMTAKTSKVEGRTTKHIIAKTANHGKTCFP